MENAQHEDISTKILSLTWLSYFEYFTALYPHHDGKCEREREREREIKLNCIKQMEKQQHTKIMLEAHHVYVCLFFKSLICIKFTFFSLFVYLWCEMGSYCMKWISLCHKKWLIRNLFKDINFRTNFYEKKEKKNQQQSGCKEYCWK